MRAKVSSVVLEILCRQGCALACVLSHLRVTDLLVLPLGRMSTGGKSVFNLGGLMLDVGIDMDPNEKVGSWGE